MKKVRFVTGYRGVLTQELHYPPGTVHEFSEGVADTLIDRGIAEPFIVEATPAATELAIKLGVDLAQVKPTGSGGRIIVSDVKRYADTA